MKIIYIFLLLSFFRLGAQGTDKAEIAKATELISTVMETKEMGKYYEVMHPKMSANLDERKKTEEFMAVTTGNRDYQLSILKTIKDNINVSEIMTSKNTKYAFSNYFTVETVKYTKTLVPADKENFYNSKKDLLFEASQLDNHTINYTRNNILVALKDASTGNVWKYVPYSPTDKKYLELVPFDIQKAADKFAAGFQNK